MSDKTQKLDDLISEGFKVSGTEYSNWAARTSHFLEAAFEYDTAQRFNAISDQSANWNQGLASQLGYLEGLSTTIPQPLIAIPRPGSAPTPFVTSVSSATQSRRVFVVHGHDTATKESLARFLYKIGLDPVILHEQPNQGRTVIEKFEKFADVAFAVVLLTPDDVGGIASEPAKLQTRARQNVIFELGFFSGRLSRGRVCALYKAGVEIPSDYQGIAYVELDSAGAWRNKLAQELVEAGFSIKIEALLG